MKFFIIFLPYCSFRDCFGQSPRNDEHRQSPRNDEYRQSPPLTIKNEK